MNNKKLISFIIPTFKGENLLPKLCDEIFLVFQNKNIEIIIVNDCSPDNSHEVCKKICEKYSDKVTYLKLSKNFGEYNAVMAGLRYSNGDVTLIMDDDYQNLPQEALKLAEYTMDNNFDVVFSKYQIKKHSFTRNLMSKVNNFTAEKLLKKPNGIYFSSFKAIKKNIVKEIIKYSGPYPYIDGLILSVTSNYSSFNINHAERTEGKSNYNLYKLAKHYGNLITNFSTMPIHIFSSIGVVITIISSVFILFAIFEKILNPEIPIGYTSIIMIIIFFSGLQILFLGLIGEYVGKILKNVNRENQYTIEYIKEKNKK